MLDNSQLILPFIPEKNDGDTFIYTELLDRGKKKGNNGKRLLKTFYHRSQEEFLSQFETIKSFCEFNKIRACTRLAPRSFKTVAKSFLRLVTETYITENYSGMKTLYSRACGITKPIRKYWLIDVDEVNSSTLFLETPLRDQGILVATIPSKKGLHYIVNPFNLSGQFHAEFIKPLDLDIHKDNPTNLYIPDGAD